MIELLCLTIGCPVVLADNRRRTNRERTERVLAAEDTSPAPVIPEWFPHSLATAPAAPEAALLHLKSTQYAIVLRTYRNSRPGAITMSRRLLTRSDGGSAWRTTPVKRRGELAPRALAVRLSSVRGTRRATGAVVRTPHWPRGRRCRRIDRRRVASRPGATRRRTPPESTRPGDRSC